MGVTGGVPSKRHIFSPKVHMRGNNKSSGERLQYARGPTRRRESAIHFCSTRLPTYEYRGAAYTGLHSLHGTLRRFHATNHPRPSPAGNSNHVSSSAVFYGSKRQSQDGLTTCSWIGHTLIGRFVN